MPYIVKREDSESYRPIDITLSGYKSIDSEQRIRTTPLTILSGANSSGKSSFMQPLLLMKQTLESPFATESFLLEGNNVKITNINQILSQCGNERKQKNSFSIGIKFFHNSHSAVRNLTNDERILDEYYNFIYKSSRNKGIFIDRVEIDVSFEKSSPVHSVIREGMKNNKISLFSDKHYKNILDDLNVQVVKNRCFLSIGISSIKKSYKRISEIPLIISTKPKLKLMDIQSIVTQLIHVPGLRGNPERAYPVTAVYDRFPGKFEKYVASIISNWESSESSKFIELCNDLSFIGVTDNVHTKRVNNVSVEVHIGRLKKAKQNKKDYVNIADTGFGISQVLPVIVALLVAEQGQFVYIEQPELHLHPNAQLALSSIILKAAKRGVRVIIETHSSLLITGIQTLVAKGELNPKFVSLNWFSRDPETGETHITSGELDENGAFGDWPEDFDDVTLQSQKDYLDAVEKRMGYAAA